MKSAQSVLEKGNTEHAPHCSSHASMPNAHDEAFQEFDISVGVKPYYNHNRAIPSVAPTPSCSSGTFFGELNSLRLSPVFLVAYCAYVSMSPYVATVYDGVDDGLRPKQCLILRSTSLLRIAILLRVKYHGWPRWPDIRR